jgi:hypothetical protein
MKRRMLASLLLFASACDGNVPIIAHDAAQQLRPLSTAAARCIAASHGRTDQPAADCICLAVNRSLGGKPLYCHDGPAVIAFKGDGLPVSGHDDDYYWYALAYVPADRLSARTEDRELTIWGQGTLDSAAGLPAHWYVLSVCKTCD